MINIEIIALGKLKENYLKEACYEYIKRLNGFCRLIINELEPVFLPQNPSDSQIESALAAESKIINDKIKQNNYKIALCIEGKKMSSESFADVISEAAVSGKSHFSFIIGSSYGLHENLKSTCDLKMSMSMMTFPHQLARVMLLEQLYRSMQINNNGKYHK